MSSSRFSQHSWDGGGAPAGSSAAAAGAASSNHHRHHPVAQSEGDFSVYVVVDGEKLSLQMVSNVFAIIAPEGR